MTSLSNMQLALTDVEAIAFNNWSSQLLAQYPGVIIRQTDTQETPKGYKFLAMNGFGDKRFYAYIPVPKGKIELLGKIGIGIGIVALIVWAIWNVGKKK